MEFENGQNDLRRSAGEILNGVKRNVEVQIMHPCETNNSYQSYTILDSGNLMQKIYIKLFLTKVITHNFSN